MKVRSYKEKVGGAGRVQVKGGASCGSSAR